MQLSVGNGRKRKFLLGDKMKVKDGITGLVVGDALGVPVEFTRKEELDENPVTGMMGHGTYDMPKGTWSDDSSMTLATMQSIVQKDGIDYEDIMNEFSLFVHESKYCQYHTFDYGNTTINAILKFDRGCLMRILPMAFIPDIDYEVIENVSALTHAHERSRIACVLYIEIARSMLSEKLEISEHIERACEKIMKHYKESDELIHFKRIFESDLDEVESSKDAVLKAVNYGRDTDTVAAICGGLAGIYYGFDDIPSEWIDDIPQIDDVFGLCEDFENFCEK